jgi:hypothetical protein
MLLGTFFLWLTFPAGVEAYSDGNAQVVVAVYNDAGVSAGELAQAERKGARIFAGAGIDVVWVDCTSSATHAGPDALVRAGEQSSPGLALSSLPTKRIAGRRGAGPAGAPAPTWVDDAECVQFDWPTHLEVRILSGSGGANDDIFGVAFLSAQGTGCYSNVFYGRARELHNSWNFPLADVVGNLMAHELGHLLLGSNSHAPAGIMRARWQGDDLRRAARSNLWFTSEQAENMRRKLIAARPRPVPSVMSARSSF